MELKNKTIICRAYGGSRLYNLFIEGVSDFDERGVFLHNDIHNVIGLGRFEHQESRAGGEDVEFKEFRAALTLIRNGNTQMLELLHNQNWLEITPLWQKVQANRAKLLDSIKIFKCLSGFAQSEIRAAFGETTGRISGPVRKAALEKYGFSPKNVVHALRLLYTGIIFFDTGQYLVNLDNWSAFREHLMEVKTNPHKLSAENLKKLCLEYDADMKQAFDNRKLDFKFDEGFADSLILEAYLPILR